MLALPGAVRGLLDVLRDVVERVCGSLEVLLDLPSHERQRFNNLQGPVNLPQAGTRSSETLPALVERVSCGDDCLAQVLELADFSHDDHAENDPDERPDDDEDVGYQERAGAPMERHGTS